MTITTAYRRICSWKDEYCIHLKDVLFPRGIRYRPLAMAAAAKLSGALDSAKSDNDLRDCLIVYELMIQDGETSEAELKLEVVLLRDELLNCDPQAHQLN